MTRTRSHCYASRGATELPALNVHYLLLESPLSIPFEGGSEHSRGSNGFYSTEGDVGGGVGPLKGKIKVQMPSP